MATMSLHADDLADTTSTELRPVAAMFTLDVGAAEVLDTYLTPITYDGVDLRLGFSAMRAIGSTPQRRSWQLDFGIDYDNVENPVGNHTMHAIMLQARWAMLWRLRNVAGTPLDLHVGPMAQLQGGAIYNSIGSNNVASVKAHAAIGATAMATYGTRLWNRHITLSDQLSLPLMGCFYSPDYDESYDEIYVGHTAGFVNFGWWGNRFDLTNLLAADFHFGGTTLRLGYRLGIQRSWVNNLNTHVTTHSIVLGVGGEFFTRSNKRESINATVVSSMY